MSKTVLHMEKFKMADVGGIEKHNKRKGKSTKNKEIDYVKSYKNIDLLENGMSYREKIKERISQLNLKRAVRKDAVVLNSFIVSSDRKFFEGMDEIQTQRFFRDALEFFKKRYGEENMVCASIHIDEVGAPHMHLGMIPVTEDGRLSSKSLFNRISLRQLQTDYAEYMSQNWNIERGTKGSKAKHLDEVTFKLEKRREEIAALENDIASLEEEKNQVSELKKEKADLIDEVEGLKKDKDSYGFAIQSQREEISRNNEKIKEQEKKIDEMQENISLISSLNEEYLDVQAKNLKIKDEIKENQSILDKLKKYIKNVFGFLEHKEIEPYQEKFEASRFKALNYLGEYIVSELDNFEYSQYNLDPFNQAFPDFDSDERKIALKYLADKDAFEKIKKKDFEGEFKEYVHSQNRDGIQR